MERHSERREWEPLAKWDNPHGRALVKKPLVLKRGGPEEKAEEENSPKWTKTKRGPRKPMWNARQKILGRQKILRWENGEKTPGAQALGKKAEKLGLGARSGDPQKSGVHNNKRGVVRKKWKTPWGKIERRKTSVVNGPPKKAGRDENPGCAKRNGKLKSAQNPPREKGPQRWEEENQALGGPHETKGKAPKGKG